MLEFLYSPSDLMPALLLASALALGVCLWLMRNEMRRLARREERLLRETERYVQQQLATLSEKMTGDLTRRRREAEQVEHALETSLRRRLDELQALIESLRIVAARLQERSVASPAEPASDPAAKDERSGLSVITRSAKAGGRENSG